MNAEQAIEAGELGPEALLRVQLALECIDLRPDGLLVPIPCANPDILPLMLVARHAAGFSRGVDQRLADTVQNALLTILPELTFQDERRVVGILRAAGFGVTVDHFHTYHFTRMPSPAEYADVQRVEDRFEVQRDGEPVSRAWSTRQNDQAAELAVETKAAFRRQGFARQVCLAWAASQQKSGRVAFYSHREQNLASRQLAQDLGVAHIMDVRVWIGRGKQV